MRTLFFRNLIFSGLFVVAILVFQANNGTAPAWAADTTVTIDNFTFSPGRLTVKAGTTEGGHHRHLGEPGRHSAHGHF